VSPPRVVIVGGGFGGLNAARAFAGADVSVTLLDRHNYHLFQPLLYQVATASLSPGDVASPIRWILRHQKNVEVLLANVRAIDPAAREVLIDDGDPVPFDYLVLAAGAAHAYFGHPEWAARAPGLKTLDDALEIRRRVLLAFEHAEREADRGRQQKLLTFVIVFSARDRVPRTFIARALPPLVFVAFLSIAFQFHAPWLIAVHLGAFFAAALVCHDALSTGAGHESRAPAARIARVRLAFTRSQRSDPHAHRTASRAPASPRRAIRRRGPATAI